MPKPLTDLSRRTFLKGSVGASVAVAVSAAYSLDILAQEADPAVAGYTFLSPSEVPILEAIAEQIWPADDTVGGRDAGVVTYIDRALSNAYTEYQPVYRLGLEWVDLVANNEYGAGFADLESDQQRALMEAWLGMPEGDAGTPSASPVVDSSPDQPANLEVEGMVLPAELATPAGTGGQGSGSTGALADAAGEQPDGSGTIAGTPMLAGGDPPQIAGVSDFLEVVLTHTIEGLFADPAYGGNRDKSVWTALQYGGPYYVHTEEQQTSFEPLDLPVQSLADL